mmetsp:Transcript_24919/g.78900  ORF Transcript_24919/g.78900 Transcript_24919/m.78900 type:complete len:202 (+) Transcript_24919:118-723(+)
MVRGERPPPQEGRVPHQGHLCQPGPYRSHLDVLRPAVHGSRQARGGDEGRHHLCGGGEQGAGSQGGSRRLHAGHVAEVLCGHQQRLGREHPAPGPRDRAALPPGAYGVHQHWHRSVHGHDGDRQAEGGRDGCRVHRGRRRGLARGADGQDRGLPRHRHRRHLGQVRVDYQGARVRRRDQLQDRGRVRAPQGPVPRWHRRLL